MYKVPKSLALTNFSLNSILRLGCFKIMSQTLF